MLSVTGQEINFKKVERRFYEIGCEIAKTMMKEFLEGLDEDLAKARDKKTLRHKGKRNRALKTLMGEVEIKRNIYRRENEKGEVEHIHLLDKELEFETIGTVSPNLAEKILDQICGTTYREVSKTVTELTNQRISHQGIWNIIQKVGEKQRSREEELIISYKSQKAQGKKEVKILFEEADGLYLKIQNQGKKELKIGIAYEGWEKRYQGSKEYKTVGKVVYGGYVTPKEFSNLREAYVAEKYNTDEIQYRILNGDGAAWISKGYDSENGVFQLDPYHISKNVIESVKDKTSRSLILKWLSNGEFKKAYDKIETLKYNCDGLTIEIKKLIQLESYLKAHEKGILNYKFRELKLPNPPEGLEYRNLGTMESNISIFASRMKGKKSWSEEGATNLVKIIALKLSGNFNEKIGGLISSTLSPKLQERFEEQVINVRDYIKKPKKSKIYNIQRGSIPFVGSSKTNGREAIQRIFNYRNFTDLIYR